MALLNKKIEPIRQMEASDCGLACLAMLFNYHGLVCDLDALRENYQLGRAGTSLFDLQKICSEFGVVSRGLKVPMDELHKVQLPMLAHWGGGHFVVIEAIMPNAVVVVDPAFGRTEVSKSYVAQMFTGFCLEITKLPEHRTATMLTEQKGIAPSLMHFVVNNSGLWPILTIAFLTLLVIQLVGLASPYLISLVLDKAIANRDNDALWLIVFSFAGLFIVRAALSFISNRLQANVSQVSMFGITNYFSSRLLELPFPYFLKRSAGDIHSRLLGSDLLKSLLDNGLLTTPFNLFYVVAAIGILFYLAALPALVVVVFLIIAVAIEWPIQNRLVVFQNTAAQMASADHVVTASALARMEFTKLNGLQLHERIRMIQTQSARYESAKAVQVMSSDSQTIIETFQQIEKLVLIVLLGGMAIDGKLTIGMTLAFLMFADESKNRLLTIVKLWGLGRISGVMMGRLADIVTTPVEKNIFNVPDTNMLHPDLALKKVGYSYSSLKPPIFSELSIHLPIGSKLLIYGPSGCGKSTILKIFCGLLSPTQGQLVVNGKPADVETLGKLRQRIGGLGAESILIQGTIRSNILYGIQDFSASDYDEVIAAVSLDHDLREVMGGENAIISADGRGVSSGQAQRILLANTLLRKPAVLILDEPTAHCDPVAAKRIVNYLEKYKGTVIVASHDLAFRESKFNVDALSMEVLIKS
jgi:ATP-binding cassette, subfamily B, bacterial CvaB/MchF/RaxB